MLIDGHGMICFVYFGDTGQIVLEKQGKLDKKIWTVLAPSNLNTKH